MIRKKVKEIMTPTVLRTINRTIKCERKSTTAIQESMKMNENKKIEIHLTDEIDLF